MNDSRLKRLVTLNHSTMQKLDASYFQGTEVVDIAKNLIGKKLCSHIDGNFTSGLIVETEAYSGTNDKACHAHLGRFTKRTAVMYQPGGVAYIYLCYGIHHLLNVVTNTKGVADAVLIRALEPLDGINLMRMRTLSKQGEAKLCAGPGKLTKALGIGKKLNGIDLGSSSEVWIETGEKIKTNDIIETTRIGIDYAEEDAFLPWRFYLKENKSVSKY